MSGRWMGALSPATGSVGRSAERTGTAVLLAKAEESSRV